MDDQLIKLLTEIRDLLVPLSAAAQPQYESLMRERHQKSIAAIVAIVGRSKSQLMAAQLLDGTRTAAEVRAATSFDASNFSKFIKKLKDAEVVHEHEGKIGLTVSPKVIPWPSADVKNGA